MLLPLLACRTARWRPLEAVELTLLTALMALAGAQAEPPLPAWGDFLAPLSPAAFPHLVSEVRTKLSAFDPSWPQGRPIAWKAGARPLSARLVADESTVDGRVVTAVGGLGGSGWTLLGGVLDWMSERLGVVNPFV